MRTDDLYLVDLIEAADDIAAAIAGCDLASFSSNREKRNAVLWSLMIIGESANKFSTDMRGQFVDVPWDQIRAFRNRLVHGYFTLKWSIVWDIAAARVPHVRSEALRILANQFPDTHRKIPRS